MSQNPKAHRSGKSNPLLQCLDSCLKNYPKNIVQYEHSGLPTQTAKIFHVLAGDLCVEQNEYTVWNRQNEDVIDQGIPGFTHFQFPKQPALYSMWPAHLSFTGAIEFSTPHINKLVAAILQQDNAPPKEQITKVLKKFKYLPDDMHSAAQHLQETLAKNNMQCEPSVAIEILERNTQTLFKLLIEEKVGSASVVIDTCGHFFEALKDKHDFSQKNKENRMLINRFSWFAPMKQAKDWLKELHDLVEVVALSMRQHRALVMVGTMQESAPQLLLAIAMLQTYFQDKHIYNKSFGRDHREVLALFERLAHQRSPQFLNDKKAFAEAYALGMNLVSLAEIRDLTENQWGEKAYHKKMLPLLDDLTETHSMAQMEEKLTQNMDSISQDVTHTVVNKLSDYRESLELTLAIHDEEQQEEYATREFAREDDLNALTFIKFDAESLAYIEEKLVLGYDVLFYENANGKTLIEKIVETYLQPSSNIKPEQILKILVKAKISTGVGVNVEMPKEKAPEQHRDIHLQVESPIVSNEVSIPAQLDARMKNFHEHFGNETLLRSAYKRCSMNMYKRISGTERDCLEKLTKTVEGMLSVSLAEQYKTITLLMREIESKQVSNKKSPIIRLVHKMQQSLELDVKPEAYSAHPSTHGQHQETHGRRERSFSSNHHHESSDYQRGHHGHRSYEPSSQGHRSHGHGSQHSSQGHRSHGHGSLHSSQGHRSHGHGAQGYRSHGYRTQVDGSQSYSTDGPMHGPKRRPGQKVEHSQSHDEDNTDANYQEKYYQQQLQKQSKKEDDLFHQNVQRKPRRHHAPPKTSQQKFGPKDKTRVRQPWHDNGDDYRN